MKGHGILFIMYDVAICGAGVVGALIARELSKYSISLCIIEKESDVAMGASKANSGIVHAGFDALPGTLKARLNVLGSNLMPQVTKKLGVKYRRNGSLVIGFNADDEKKLAELYERGIKNGVRGLELISGDAARELEKNLSPAVTAALWAKTGGIVCPYGLCIAACGNAMDNGADLVLNFEIKGIERVSGGYKISSQTRNIYTKHIINAAGMGAAAIAEMITKRKPAYTITPRRGEYMILDKECGALTDCTIFRTPTAMGKGILVSPTVDGNCLLGPTADDIENGADTATTAAGLDKISAEARSYVPSVPLRSVITSFSGNRSVSSTGDFIIEVTAPNVITLAGIDSPGLTASPAIALYISHMLQSEFGLDLEPKHSFFATRRESDFFRNMSEEEKNSYIIKHPEYGRIVCRCEQVSEGEIIDAIRANPPATDIDGIKRRTRSGMGRCQGGFCSPTVAEIISRETGISYQKITKRGKWSYINLRKAKSATKA